MSIGLKEARCSKLSIPKITWQTISGWLFQQFLSLFPSEPGESCNYLANGVASQCVQVFTHHRLLAWDHERGLYLDIFKVGKFLRRAAHFLRKEDVQTESEKGLALKGWRAWCVRCYIYRDERGGCVRVPQTGICPSYLWVN